MRLVAVREGRSGFSYHAWQVASGYVAAALSGASPPIFFFLLRELTLQGIFVTQAR